MFQKDKFTTNLSSKFGPPKLGIDVLICEIQSACGYVASVPGVDHIDVVL